MEKNRTSENSLNLLAKQYEQTRVEEATALITYIGFSDFGVATSSPKWIIMKIEKSAATVPYETVISYATSYKNDKNIWDDRASLTYYS
jgi:hypothetical protein